MARVRVCVPGPHKAEQLVQFDQAATWVKGKTGCVVDSVVISVVGVDLGGGACAGGGSGVCSVVVVVARRCGCALVEGGGWRANQHMNTATARCTTAAVIPQQRPCHCGRLRPRYPNFPTQTARILPIVWVFPMGTCQRRPRLCNAGTAPAQVAGTKRCAKIRVVGNVWSGHEFHSLACSHLARRRAGLCVAALCFGTRRARACNTSNFADCPCPFPYACTVSGLGKWLAFFGVSSVCSAEPFVYASGALL